MHCFLEFHVILCEKGSKSIKHNDEMGAAIGVELDGEVYIPIHDPYSNVVALLDSSGHPVENYRPSAFGEETENYLNPWRFSRMHRDEEKVFCTLESAIMPLR